MPTHRRPARMREGEMLSRGERIGGGSDEAGPAISVKPASPTAAIYGAGVS